MPPISNPHRTHLLSYANFTIKPIVECFPTIFTRSFHFNHIPSCLVMQKIFVAYSIVASHHGKKYHFCLQTNQPPHYIVRMSCAPHQNHHIFWRVRTIIASWHYIFAPICRAEFRYSQIFIMNIIIFCS